jgi:hypothetical protein
MLHCVKKGKQEGTRRNAKLKQHITKKKQNRKEKKPVPGRKT